MKTVLLTSNSLRHQYISRCLEGETDLQLIITEEKSVSIEATNHLHKKDQIFIKQHFEKRERSEENFFKKNSFPEAVVQLKVPHKEINTELTLKILEELDPDIIVLFGTSIIKASLLKTFPGRFVNLHLGLSPWYKGSATNLFPLLYKEPQFIGATIHIATAEVDSGSILHQLRPDIQDGDGLHDIGNRVIEKAGEILPEILKKYFENKIDPKYPKGDGRLCKIRDLTPEKLREIYQNIEEGIIPEYLAKKRIIDKQFPIISNLN